MLPQFTSDATRVIDAATRAEELELDSIFLYDHLWPLAGGKERPILESWTTLAWLAASTTKIRIGSLVTRSTLRHPAVLAKMVATVGAIAPGRLIAGIGSGDKLSREENEAFGLPYYAGDDRTDELRSVVEIVTRFLREDRVSVHDDFHEIRDLPTSPRAESPPAVWVGGRGEELLRTAGELADGWNGWGGSPRRFAQDAHVVLDAAQGRPVELSWAGQMVLGKTRDQARDKLGGRDPLRYLVGDANDLARHLESYIDTGARHIVMSFTDAARPETYELYAQVRARLALA